MFVDRRKSAGGQLSKYSCGIKGNGAKRKGAERLMLHQSELEVVFLPANGSM